MGIGHNKRIKGGHKKLGCAHSSLSIAKLYCATYAGVRCMNKLCVLFLLYLLTGCTINKYNPEEKRVISSLNCEGLNGYYTLNFDEYYHYNKAGFWQLRQYDRFKINVDDKQVLFVGESKGKNIASLILNSEGWSCSNGILSVNLDNVIQNNGGVSVYQARSLNLYSYKTGEVHVQFKELSSGLAFLIPVSVGEDSRVILNSVTHTPNKQINAD